MLDARVASDGVIDSISINSHSLPLPAFANASTLVQLSDGAVSPHTSPHDESAGALALTAPCSLSLSLVRAVHRATVTLRSA